MCLVPHVEIDVGVIVRRGRPQALELLDADPDPVDALIVHEMRHERLGHDRRSIDLACGNASEHSDPEAKAVDRECKASSPTA
jgi:hypothetical protein